MSLTERCNLRCPYCFIPHRPWNLSLENGLRAINLLFDTAQSENYSEIVIKYAGGEPTLLPELLFRLHEQAQKRAGETGLRYHPVLLTNGTLLSDSLLRKLLAVGLSLSISIDGTGEGHNAHRAYLNGRASSTKVTEAVDRAIAIGVNVSVSLTLSSQNFREFPDFMNWLACRDLSLCINFYRETDYAQRPQQLAFDDQALIDSIRAGYQEYAAHFPLQKPLVSHLDLLNLSFPHLNPCGTGRSAIAIGAHGEIQRCQMQPEAVEGSVNDLKPLEFLAKGQAEYNPSVDTKIGCQQCLWRYTCTGGCPLLAKRVSGSYNHPSPYCKIYQELIPDLIRWEAERLIAVHG